MKKLSSALIVTGTCLSLLLAGCAQEKAASSKEAIEVAKEMETTEQKVDSLLKQANAFYNSKEFQEAVNTAQYILRYLDKDSQQAKDLLQKAKEALASAAKGAVEDVKQKFEGFAP